MDKTPKDHHSFFKVLATERSGTKLKIPTAYTQYMRRNLPTKVFLRDRYGNLWMVDVEETQSERYFVAGWPKFVNDNSLEVGDFIVFKYDGFNVFEVKIFGCTSSEKEGVGGSQIRLEDEKEDLEKEHNDHKEDNNDNDYEEEEKQEYVEEQKEDHEDEHKGEKNEDDDDEKLINSSKKRAVISMSKGCGSKHLKETDSKTPHGDSTAVKGESSAGKKSATTTYAEEIFRSGCISPPKNPYFVTKIKQKRRNELIIPIHVIKDYNLDLPSEMAIRDSDGREWLAKLKPWKDSRVCYYGGLASFCRVNRVQETDTCICEFVKREEKGKYYIHVTIVREM